MLVDLDHFQSISYVQLRFSFQILSFGYKHLHNLLWSNIFNIYFRIVNFLKLSVVEGKLTFLLESRFRSTCNWCICFSDGWLCFNWYSRCNIRAATFETWAARLSIIRIFVWITHWYKTFIQCLRFGKFHFSNKIYLLKRNKFYIFSEKDS